MSEIEERFMSTLQQELEYQKRKNSELLSYAEKNHKLIEELLARAEKAEAERDELKRRAVKAEEERDDLQRKLSKSEAEVKALHDAVDYLEGKSHLQEFRLEQALDELKRRAVNAETQWEEWEEKAKKLFGQYAQVRDALEKSEVERDEWKRRAGNAEFEVKRQRDLMNPVDWERVRIEAAIAAMQGVLANPDQTAGPESMVYFADALVAELQKKEVQG